MVQLRRWQGCYIQRHTGTNTLLAHVRGGGHPLQHALVVFLHPATGANTFPNSLFLHCEKYCQVLHKVPLEEDLLVLLAWSVAAAL